MNHLSRSAIIALVLTCGFTAFSTGSKTLVPLVPLPSPLKPGSLAGSIFEANGKDIFGHVVKQMPFQDVVNVGKTSWIGYDAAGQVIKQVRLIATNRVAEIMLSTDPTEVSGALAEVRDSFLRKRGGFGSGPLHFPSCFSPNYTLAERARCLLNLWHDINSNDSIMDIRWIRIPTLDFVHAAVQGFKQGGLNPHTWYCKIATRNEGQLLDDIHPISNWSSETLDCFVLMLMYIQSVQQNQVFVTTSQAIRRAVFARIYHLVEDIIRPHVDHKQALIKDGYATLKSVIDSLYSYLSSEPAIILSGFLTDLALHLSHTGEYNPLYGMDRYGHQELGIHDIIRGLLRTMRVSFTDRINVIKSLSNFPWDDLHKDSLCYGMPAYANSRRRPEPFTPSQRIQALLISALLGSHPPPGLLIENDPNSAKEALEWLEWQMRLWLLKHLVVKRNLKLALEALDNFKKWDLIPRWVKYNLLEKKLRRLVKDKQDMH